MNPRQRCQDWQHHRWHAAWRDLDADIERYLTKSAENIALGRSRKRWWSAFLTPELQCLALHRLAHLLHCRGWPRAATLASRLNQLLHKVQIPATACIGPGCRLSHPAGVVFEGSAGRELTLFGMAVCCTGPAADPPVLGDGVTLGAHAVLQGPLRVGSRCQIGPFACLGPGPGAVPDDSVVVARSMLSRARRPRSPAATSRPGENP